MLQVIRGANDKTAYTEKLISILESNNMEGLFYSGYPVIGGFTDKLKIDAMLLSERNGLIIFSINQGSDFVDMTELHDELYTLIEVKLKGYKKLLDRRKLLVDINIVEFAPTWNNEKLKLANDDFLVCNEDNINQLIESMKWDNSLIYPALLEAIQSVSQLKKSATRNNITNENSRGGKLRKLDDEISNLDHCQSKAVIETVKGVQRIRGLAGSGKTIVLALKVAYLYSMYDDKQIAVTFNTRSLKKQFENLINKFIIENTNEEPDWSRIHIIQAWGSSKNEGIYYNFCMENNVEYLDYSTAKSRFKNTEDSFEEVCRLALTSVVSPKQLYDMILIDEAQDFSKSFLRLCYHSLPSDSKMLVYAYDELQSLNSNRVEAPEELFGYSNGKPLVTLRNEENKPTEDVILHKCYRNSRPVLTTAHALGFGIYRSELVQLFEDKKLWKDIGYEIISGRLEDDQKVRLKRSAESSPEFLETHSEIDDLIQFKKFDNPIEEAEWISKDILTNLKEEELRFRDIIIIHPNPISTRKYVSHIRNNLMKNGIESHIAGYHTSPDQFFADNSITITQIYRAKGNEAAMVYFVNADFCYDGANLASKRNILFTGITRSKSWVRVTGCGKAMESLIDEFNQVKSHEFEMEFTYPNSNKREKLKIIHRDKTKNETEEINRSTSQIEEIIKKLNDGKIQKEDLPRDLVDSLLGVFKDEA